MKKLNDMNQQYIKKLSEGDHIVKYSLYRPMDYF